MGEGGIKGTNLLPPNRVCSYDSRHAVCVKGEKLYLFGGADALSRCNDVYEYDFCEAKLKHSD